MYEPRTIDRIADSLDKHGGTATLTEISADTGLSGGSISAAISKDLHSSHPTVHRVDRGMYALSRARTRFPDVENAAAAPDVTVGEYARNVTVGEESPVESPVDHVAEVLSAMARLDVAFDGLEDYVRGLERKASLYDQVLGIVVPVGDSE